MTTKRLLHESDASSSDSDAPETVSMSTSKNVILTQIKAEREAKRNEKEKKRKRTVAQQEQNRQARLKKLEETQAEVDGEESVNEEETGEAVLSRASSTSELAPLPDSVIQSAIQSKKIRFDSESEDDLEETDPEAARKQRAAEARKRLLKNLPFGVSEVGVEGRARITREEVKARRAISRSKLEKAGSNVRRINSVLDRARKTSGPAKLFSRTF